MQQFCFNFMYVKTDSLINKAASCIFGCKSDDMQHLSVSHPNMKNTLHGSLIDLKDLPLIVTYCLLYRGCHMYLKLHTFLNLYLGLFLDNFGSASDEHRLDSIRA